MDRPEVLKQIEEIQKEKRQIKEESDFIEACLKHDVCPQCGGYIQKVETGHYACTKCPCEIESVPREKLGG